MGDADGAGGGASVKAAYYLATGFALLVLAGVVVMIGEHVHEERVMAAWRALRPR